MFEWDREADAYGVTVLENRFLQEYLPLAKGDFVKVYLWGLYACAHKGPDYSLREMAEEIGLEVQEIEAALRYWERRSLVSRISDNPPQYRFYSPTQRLHAPGAALQVDMEYVSFAESVYAAFGDRRKVSPNEIALAWEWVQDIGLPPEAVLMLLHQCMAQRGVNFSFKKAEPLAVRMKDAGVHSPDDADAFLRHHQDVHDGVKKLLSRMGKRRFPSEDELDLYEKWTGEWKFEPRAVLDACAQMTSGDPSFKYLDGILGRLRKQGDARTGEQVQQQLAQERDEKSRAQEVFARLGVRLAAPAAARLYQEMTALQPHGVLLLAADECARIRKGPKAEDMLALLQSWKDRGLTDEEAVQSYIGQYKQKNLALRELFDACGYEGRPTEADRQLYDKWTGWGYGRDLLLFAAEQSRGAQGSKLAYLDKVLEAWHEAGITQLSQAKAGHRKEPAPKGRGGKTVSAQQYGQRDYTEEELLAVSDDLIEEARKHRG